MPRILSRATLAIKNIASKARWSRKALPFSRNNPSRGAGASSSSDSPFQNPPPPSVLPADPLFIHCYPNVFPDMCYCSECVQYCRTAPQLLDEHYMDYDLAQVSVGLPPQLSPLSVMDVDILPTSPSVTSLPDLHDARTDEELFADIEELFSQIDQWYIKHGFFPEDPMVPSSERQIEVLSTASESESEPTVIVTFVEPQPTLSPSEIINPLDLVVRTDEELFADIEQLFLVIEQCYDKHSLLLEDPVSQHWWTS